MYVLVQSAVLSCWRAYIAYIIKSPCLKAKRRSKLFVTNNGSNMGRPRLSDDVHYNSAHRRAVRKYQLTHPENEAGWKRDFLIQRRSWLNEYKSSRGCKNCGEKDPRCLDFHHKDSMKKVKEVSQMFHLNKDALLNEIEKCDILCANCHRKITIIKRAKQSSVNRH